MTTKRDKKDGPKAAKRPKLKKETLKDLEAKDAEGVKAGAARLSGQCRDTDFCSNQVGCSL